MMKNKKAQGMSWQVILLILAMIVLVVMVYVWYTASGSSFQEIFSFGGGKVNVATVVRACNLACSIGSYYDFCERERKVVFPEEYSMDNRDNWKCYGLTVHRKRLRLDLEECGSVDCTQYPEKNPLE